MALSVLLDGTETCTYHCDSIFVEGLYYECHECGRIFPTVEEPFPNGDIYLIHLLDKVKVSLSLWYFLFTHSLGDLAKS